MQDRIARLEEQIAHLARAVEDLSDIVRLQGDQLDRAQYRLRMLMEREAEREAAEGTQIPLADQRPPHW